VASQCEEGICPITSPKFREEEHWRWLSLFDKNPEIHFFTLTHAHPEAPSVSSIFANLQSMENNPDQKYVWELATGSVISCIFLHTCFDVRHPDSLYMVDPTGRKRMKEDDAVTDAKKSAKKKRIE